MPQKENQQTAKQYVTSRYPSAWCHFYGPFQFMVKVPNGPQFKTARSFTGAWRKAAEELGYVRK